MSHRRVFQNYTPKRIRSGAPSDVSSVITVPRGAGKIAHVAVLIDVYHTYTSDLRIVLKGPAGQEVLLVGRKGGSGNNFLQTVFDDRSGSSIIHASAPFRGVFRPETPLAAFNDTDAEGEWTLTVQDKEFLDGGLLNFWLIAFDEVSRPQFQLDVIFRGGLSGSQQSAFVGAADRWKEIIVGPLPQVETDVGPVSGIVIDAQGTFIDGANGTLGAASPTAWRSGSFLPSRGIMVFDTSDLASLEAAGSLFEVIFHEMGHCLGIGTIWGYLGLRQGTWTTDPIFVGTNAMREFGALLGGGPLPVPIENEGGVGTAGGHWRELTFGREIMTGGLNNGINPVSRVTIAAMEDMGYEVDLNAADPYSLPSPFSLVLMGIHGDSGRRRRRCAMLPPSPVVLTM